MVEEVTQKKTLKERIKEALDVGGEGTVSAIGGIMTESLIGQVAPGITTVAFSYKQKRLEKNMMKFIELINEKQNELAEHIQMMREEQAKAFTDCIELVTDYVIDEPQEDKIEYMVNGLVELSTHEEIKEDFVLHYYDVLKELRLVDIDVLNFYYHPFAKLQKVIDKHQLSGDQYQSVRLKLERNGLLKTKFDDQMEDLYENMVNLQKFIEDLTKGKATKLKRLNRLRDRDSFSVSKFGRDFVSFFLNEANQGDTEPDIDDMI